MKKNTVIKVTAAILAMSAILSLTGCANSEKDKLEPTKTIVAQIPDETHPTDEPKNEAPEETDKDNEADSNAKYQEMIDSFVSNKLNTFELSVGEAHKPQASLWLQTMNGEVYTSDPNVIQISDLGKVTAVGEGSAYVVICCATLYQVYRYDVYGASNDVSNGGTQSIMPGKHPGAAYDHDAYIEVFVSNKLNTFSLLIGQDHKPNASVWMNGPNSAVYTSDPSVVSVSELGQVSAVGEGVAYVIYYAGTLVQVYMYEVSSN